MRIEDSVAVVTLNRPDYRNAQNSVVTYALDAAFQRAVEDGACRTCGQYEVLRGRLVGPRDREHRPARVGGVGSIDLGPAAEHVDHRERRLAEHADGQLERHQEPIVPVHEHEVGE